MRLPDGNVSLTINGTNGQGYSVLAGTNVALPLASWTILQSGTLPGTPVVFNDLASTNFAQRFYSISSP
jgi:hypothetical protein